MKITGWCVPLTCIVWAISGKGSATGMPTFMMGRTGSSSEKVRRLRVEVLSDHGGEQLELRGADLRDADSRLMEWQEFSFAVQQEMRAIWRAKPWWKRVLGVSTAAERDARARIRDAHEGLGRAGYDRQEIERQWHRWASGKHGENVLAWSLSGLDDSWTMLRGYRNRRGETDHVVVGPQGMWMIEVKRWRIHLHATGDDWWYERVDSRGRVYKTDWAADKSRRSWARQVNEPAADLAVWLGKNGHHVPINTAVVLVHERAVVAEISNPTVNLVAANPTVLRDAMLSLPVTLTARTCEEIVALIRRDHKYHQRDRARRGHP
jgi:hypothetical protein